MHVQVFKHVKWHEKRQHKLNLNMKPCVGFGPYFLAVFFQFLLGKLLLKHYTENVQKMTGLQATRVNNFPWQHGKCIITALHIVHMRGNSSKLLVASLNAVINISNNCFVPLSIWIKTWRFYILYLKELSAYCYQCQL